MTERHTLHACYRGFVTQAVIINLTPLLFIVFQTDYAVTDEMLGRLILMNFGMQIFVDYFAVRVVDRIGYRMPLVFSHICSAVGLIFLALLPRILPVPYTGLLIAVGIYAVGGGLAEVVISPVVESLSIGGGAANMSLLHSFYCWGQMVVVAISTLALRVIGTDLWYLLPVLWSILPIYNVFVLLKVPLPKTVAVHDRIPLRALFSAPAFLISLLMMISAGASELMMSQWSSFFAEKGLGVNKVLGDLLGPCFFAALMATGRAAYGKLGEKLDIEKWLWFSGVFCVVCYLVTVLSPLPIVSLLGCAFCGLSVSLMWPGTLSLSAARFPNGGTMMFGLLALAGDLGASAGAWLVGLVSDLVQKNPAFISFAARSGQGMEQFGLKCGLFIGTFFPVITVIGTLALRRIPRPDKIRESN